MRLSELKLDSLTIVRDGTFDVMAKCEDAPDMPTLTFLSDKKYLSVLRKSKNISCVITTPELIEFVPDNMGLCVSASPRRDFFLIHNELAAVITYARPRFKTKIGSNCTISKLACISEENVIIGDNVTIEEFVSIKPNVEIGNNTIIRAGSVIGGSGYEYKRDGDSIIDVKHLGGVILGDNVEVLHNVYISPSVFPWDNTVINDHTKIDNLVSIAHSCKIGRRNFITAGAVLSGNVVTEDDVDIGLNATISRRIKMKNRSTASLGSVVIRNVRKNKTVSGNFAVDHEKLLRFIVTEIDK